MSAERAKMSSGIGLATDFLAAYGWMKNDTDDTNFVLGSFGNNVVDKVSSGSSIDELLASLNDDNVYFGCFGALVESQPKFFTISIYGENVNGMKKGKASMAKSGVLNLFEIAHGEISFGDGVGEVSRDTIIQKIKDVCKQSNVELR